MRCKKAFTWQKGREGREQEESSQSNTTSDILPKTMIHILNGNRHIKMAMNHQLVLRICSTKKKFFLSTRASVIFKKYCKQSQSTKKIKQREHIHIRLSAAYRFFVFVLNGANKCFCVHTNCWFRNRTFQKGLFLCRSNPSMPVW